MSRTEFQMIDRIRDRLGAQADVVLGIGDDAAIIRPMAGRHLAVSCDTLVSGVHYPKETLAADIGWKSLAVNLSDMAAMGARPRWVTLSLTLASADDRWLDDFLDGFLKLAVGYGVALVGGDTCQGPESVSVTVIGSVPSGMALRRDLAQVGDDIWVTGTIGDAAAALARWKRDGQVGLMELADRLNRPTPRVAAGLALRGIANAAIDVSDGLLADLGHVLTASSVGAGIDADAIPASVPVAALPVELRRDYQLNGGDDYELCFTAPTSSREAIRAAMLVADTRAVRIGSIVGEPGICVKDPSGAVLEIPERGFQHFDHRSTTF